jgi:hypothetical protein
LRNNIYFFFKLNVQLPVGSATTGAVAPETVRGLNLSSADLLYIVRRAHAEKQSNNALVSYSGYPITPQAYITLNQSAFDRSRLIESEQQPKK